MNCLVVMVALAFSLLGSHIGYCEGEILFEMLPDESLIYVDNVIYQCYQREQNPIDKNVIFATVRLELSARGKQNAIEWANREDECLFFRKFN